MALPPLPRHHIQPKSVWNDRKGHTFICLDIWENHQGYIIEFLILFGEKRIDFTMRPWKDVYEAIKSDAMVRNFTEEFKYLRAKSKT